MLLAIDSNLNLDVREMVVHSVSTPAAHLNDESPRPDELIDLYSLDESFDRSSAHKHCHRRRSAHHWEPLQGHEDNLGIALSLRLYDGALYSKAGCPTLMSRKIPTNRTRLGRVSSREEFGGSCAKKKAPTGDITLNAWMIRRMTAHVDQSFRHSWRLLTLFSAARKCSVNRRASGLFGS